MGKPRVPGIAGGWSLVLRLPVAILCKSRELQVNLVALERKVVSWVFPVLDRPYVLREM